ncbi:ribosome recycling factor [Candidatus Peregrinibacteria bacterium]|jgi:ribosome recycling factor|nr:ribosome recycling factor [Candidatus Peregrinibacteria bacterium]MBT3598324.1 ribosome recycling factor [Candidatus Peregrinibacteria bacterium]MBT4367081.1 ribosome recycling factor [Candidatus Peregrinibacteria bacterium]MBT6730514.1 ribosome recycling factor [Candidatus Peregrinibacteria bacterium]MBT7009640.1 ribosome recycling factor [Candidatus Peregrinibacteria bacterium]
MDVRIESFNAEVAKVEEFLHKEYAKLQTGRANAALVDHTVVTAYGQKQELKAVASVSVQDARTIVIQPWDNGILNQVEAAITALDLGTSPVNDGSVIRLNLPPMTEERRKDLVKVVHVLAEEARITIRQQRQEVNDSIKEEKDEDLRYTLQEQLDKAAKNANDSIETLMKKKEEDVMQV